MYNTSESFEINKYIGGNITDLIIEGDIFIPENQSGMEKILSTNGKFNLENISSSDGKISIYGDLLYTILYRSNDENSTIKPINGKINFIEEIPVNNAKENMKVSVTPSIDYIDSKISSERKAVIKAVINVCVDVTNTTSIISPKEQIEKENLIIKTDTISYENTNIIDTSNLNINESIYLNPNENEIADILHIDINPIIKETDIMNDRMLIEGLCKVKILYSEDNNLNILNFVEKEFPFTHYIETNTLNADSSPSLNIKANNYTYTTDTDDNDEKKIINLNADFTLSLENTTKNNISYISDIYSTSNKIDIENNPITIYTSIGELESQDKIEKIIDIDNATIKDIYYYNGTPKISEKKIYEDSIVVDGFVDINILYLNSETDKIDNVFTSAPFTISIDSSNYSDIHIADIDIELDNIGAYRKGLNSILFEGTINSYTKLKKKISISPVTNISIGEKLNIKSMPSIIFRVIQPSDTLWDISKAYNVSMDYICQLNNIDANSELTPGTKLIITKQL